MKKGSKKLTAQITEIAVLAGGAVVASQITAFLEKQTFAIPYARYIPFATSAVGIGLAYMGSGHVRTLGLGIAGQGMAEGVENLVFGATAPASTPAVQGNMDARILPMNGEGVRMGFTPQMMPEGKKAAAYGGVPIR